MGKLNFYFDEAGYMGRLRDDISSNELSIIGGIVVSEEEHDKLELDINKILTKLNIENVGKVHATELFKDKDNQEVRKKLFEVLKQYDGWNLVFTAVYPKGIYEFYKGCKKEKNYIYKLLLESTIHILDELCKLKDCNCITMISDHIDKGVLKSAEKILNNSKKEIITVKKTKEYTVEFVKNSELIVKYIESIKVDKKENNLVLTADILINYLYRFLKNKISKINNKSSVLRLHSANSFEDFILKDKIFIFNENHLFDNIFRPI